MEKLERSDDGKSCGVKVHGIRPLPLLDYFSVCLGELLLLTGGEDATHCNKMTELWCHYL